MGTESSSARTGLLCRQNSLAENRPFEKCQVIYKNMHKKLSCQQDVAVHLANPSADMLYYF